MPKICPPGKIINPVTNRCVSINGPIGKALLNNADRPENIMQQGTTLPTQMIENIVNYLSEGKQNCGSVIKMLRTTHLNLQTLSPKLRKQLQASVIKSLKIFHKRFNATRFLRFAAMKSQAEPNPRTIQRRISDTISLAGRTTDPRHLVTYCRKIVEFKKEARQIVDQLRNVVQYIDTYRRTRASQQNYMGNLVVYTNHLSSEEDDLHRVNTWISFFDPHYKVVANRWFYAAKKKVQRDELALAKILAPVDINE